MFLMYIPICLFFLLEFARKSPVKEEKQNRGSSIIIGAVLTWMILIPSFIFFFFVHFNSPILLGLGMIIGLVGVWIRFSSMKTLGRFYSRNVGIQGEHDLVQNGWYRYIRHPGYLGTFLTFLGFAISTSSWVSIFVNMILFFAAYSYRIKVEEQALVSLFGEKYRQYQTKTWKMIPFLF